MSCAEAPSLGRIQNIPDATRAQGAGGQSMSVLEPELKGKDVIGSMCFEGPSGYSRE